MIKDINSIFDYFIAIDKQKRQNKEESFKSQLETLKNMHNAFMHDSSFFANLCLITFFENIKENKISINDMIENSYLSKIPSLYEDVLYEQKYSHQDQQEKLEKLVGKWFPNCTDDSLQKLSSYVSIEALSELNKAEIRFLPKSMPNTSFSPSLFDNYKVFKTDVDALDHVATLPYGFHLVHVQTRKALSKATVGVEPILISHQGKGMTIIRFESRRRNTIASRVITSLVFNNIVSKEHDIKVEHKQVETGKELIVSQVREETNYNSIINQVILELFIQFFLQEDSDSNYQTASLMLMNGTQAKGSTLPVVSQYQNEDARDFTFDDLRWSGKYQFLSFLDDMFKDVLPMDIVNHVSHDDDTITIIRSIDGDDSYNNFKLRDFKMADLPVDVHHWNSAIHPINTSIVGTVEENIKLRKKIAMANKISLYDYYLNKYLSEGILVLNKDLRDLIIENFDEIIKDEVLLSYAKLGSCRATQTNSGSFFTTGFEGVCVKGQDFDSKNIDWDNLKDIEGKAKAHTGLVINFQDVKAYEHLQNVYGWKPNEISKNVILCEMAYHKLHELFEKEGNDVISNLFNFHNLSIDIELYLWMRGCYNFMALTIPMKKSRFDEFKAFADEKGFSISTPSYRGSKLYR